MQSSNSHNIGVPPDIAFNANVIGCENAIKMSQAFYNLGMSSRQLERHFTRLAKLLSTEPIRHSKWLHLSKYSKKRRVREKYRKKIWGGCLVDNVKKVTATEIKIALAKINTKNYFLTEVKSGSTYMGTANRILDALAIKKSWVNKCFTGYEIKVSRSDFKADNKMYTYMPLVHQLYLVCPKGLIQPEELPIEIGLIWYNPEKQTLVYKKKTPRRNIEIDTDMLLYIIYSRLEEDRIPFYSDKAEFLKDWLENKNSNRDLGYRVGGELAQRISNLEKQLEDTQKFGAGKEMEHYKEILQACITSGMPEWYTQGRNTYAADWIKKELKRSYPEVLDTVQSQLEVATRAIQRAKEVTNEQV